MSVVPFPGVAAFRGSPYAHDFANGVVQGTLSAVGPSKPFNFYGTMNLWVWTQFVTTLTTTAGSLNATVASAGAIAAGAAVYGANVPYGTTIGSIAGTDVTLKLPTYTFTAKSKNANTSLTDIYDTSKLLGATVSGLGVTSGQTVSAVATPSVIVAGNSTMNTPGVVTLSAVTTEGPQNQQPTPFEFALSASGAVSSGADTAAIFTSAAIGLTGTIQVERSFDGGKTWIVANIGGSGMLAQFSTTTPVSIAFGEPERETLYRLNLTALSAVAGNTLNYRISATGQQATTLSVQTL